MIHHTEKYDEELRLISFYQSYPEFLPFIGKNYDESPKVLIFGESHYFPDESTNHKNVSEWYKKSSLDLLDIERPWINTRRVVNNIHGVKDPIPQRWKKSRTIYRNIESSLIDSGFSKTANSLCHIAFMNAFLRPAEEKGQSIKVREIDVKQSILVINQIIEIIKPEHVCFVSSKASKYIAKNLTIPSDSVPHPASIWWNRRSKNGVGKELFVDLLKSYKQ